MHDSDLIEEYMAGPQLVKCAVAEMDGDDLDAVPISGKWSTRQVVCHIADFELVYADRMKRVIAENQPTMFGGEPDVFAAHLAYGKRNVQEEVQFIESVRRHVAAILRTLAPDDFERSGIHTADGPVTLEMLLRNITAHIPHHVHFIKQKRAAMGC